MKWLIVLLVLCFGGYFLYQRTVAATVSLYDECVVQSRAEMVTTAGRAIGNICSSNQMVLQRLSVCLESVQQQKALAGLLYSPSGAEDRVAVLISQHNEACPKNTVPIPTAELYF